MNIIDQMMQVRLSRIQVGIGLRQLGLVRGTKLIGALRLCLRCQLGLQLHEICAESVETPLQVNFVQ